MNPKWRSHISPGPRLGWFGWPTCRAIEFGCGPGASKFLLVRKFGEEPFNAFPGVPIMHQGRVLGVLVAQQRDPRRFERGKKPSW
ncbi:MAG: hypothetical protein CM15mP120_06770 [Pseudomonadota bacterium]|nr:MAG: hypothetical protein CM15mP120_06770 [Pseudomonadota bacterium]